MKIYAENRKAYYDYEILKKYEAGLSLIGQEVKSIKMGRVNLKGSYIIVYRDIRGAARTELVNAKISAYQPANLLINYNPERFRQLLLNKKEINYLIDKTKQKGFSLVPLKIYERNGKLKLEFGLVRGKKKYDKKEKIKKRQIEKDIKRALNN